MIGKKILVVARSTGGHRVAGGMESSYEQIVREMTAAGAIVSLLTTRGINRPELLPTYERVWEINGGVEGKYSVSWWVRSFLHSASWSDWKPDLIFSVSSAAATIVLRPTNAGKTIVQCHGTALAEVRTSLSTRSVRELAKVPLNILRIVREVLMYRKIGRVIAIGPSVYEHLVSPPIRVPPEKISLINNGVDERIWAFSGEDRRRFREKLDLNDDSHVGIFVARLHHQKGADIAIRALSLMDKSLDAHLVVCGAGPAKFALQELSEKLGIVDRVHFVGQLPSGELATALSAADVFIFPTRRKEGLPLNILEALGNGLPVLTVVNANVPTELSLRTVIVEGSPVSFAREWAKVSISESRHSHLTQEFTKNFSCRTYIRQLSTMISQAEDNLR